MQSWSRVYCSLAKVRAACAGVMLDHRHRDARLWARTRPAAGNRCGPASVPVQSGLRGNREHEPGLGRALLRDDCPQPHTTLPDAGRGAWAFTRVRRRVNHPCLPRHSFLPHRNDPVGSNLEARLAQTWSASTHSPASSSKVLFSFTSLN